MKYTVKISIDENTDNIIRLFEAEEKEFQNQRAKYSITKKNNITEFSIKAKDPTALRAVLNSIIKNLIVYEKVKNG